MPFIAMLYTNTTSILECKDMTNLNDVYIISINLIKTSDMASFSSITKNAIKPLLTIILVIIEG